MRECGFPTFLSHERKTVDRVEAMKSLAGHAAIDYEWTKEELEGFLSGLSLEEFDRWQPHEVCLVHELVHTRFVSTELTTISYYAEMMAKIAEYYHAHYFGPMQVVGKCSTPKCCIPILFVEW